MRILVIHSSSLSPSPSPLLTLLIGVSMVDSIDELIQYPILLRGSLSTKEPVSFIIPPITTTKELLVVTSRVEAHSTAQPQVYCLLEGQ